MTNDNLRELKVIKLETMISLTDGDDECKYVNPQCLLQIERQYKMTK